MYYTPRRANGKAVPIPWQIKTLYVNLAWPLRDNPTALMRIVDKILVTMAGLTYILVDEGEIGYIVHNLSDISLSTQAMVTCSVLNECLLRIFHATLTKNSCKVFYKRFFEEIYIDAEENSEVSKKIQRRLIPTTVFTYGYIFTLATFLAAPFIKRQKDLPYKMILHYSYEDPVVYALTMVYLTWIGSSVIFFFIGDGYLLPYCIVHLHARYKMLEDEVGQWSSVVLATAPSSQMAAEFHRRMLRSFLKICDLNYFFRFLNEVYSFRIFVMISFSTVLLCVLCFQFATLGLSSENLGYASWIVAKITELLIFGTLGSTLTDTTDNVSSTYYLSNWEQIVFHSTNRKENILLMKGIRTIMSLHRNPMRLSGNGFFYVSLDTVIKVLRGAFSYFTCLYTVKQTTE